MKCLAVLIVLGTTIPVIASVTTVQGRLRFVDDLGREEQAPRLYGSHNVHFFQKRPNGNVDCGTAPVSNESFQTIEVPLKQECTFEHLFAELVLAPRPAGWEQHPEPTEVPACKVDQCSFVIEVRRPLAPPRVVRTANLDKGFTIAKDNPGGSLLLLREASVGSDVEYSAKAAEFLEKSGRQRDVPVLYEGKDLAGVPDKLTRFHMLMRWAFGERAAKHPARALQVLAEAQKTYPENSQVAAAALAVVSDDTSASTPKEYTKELNENRTLSQPFTEVLNHWDKPGKPEILNPDGTINKDAVTFTIRHSAPLPPK